jgi:hypothetical protein
MLAFLCFLNQTVVRLGLVVLVIGDCDKEQVGAYAFDGGCIVS